jgi:short subunit dehydrogenase-like uncharacterized protein
MPDFMIYGANGYTGSLIAEESALRGMCPLLAGRNADKLAALADKLGLEYRAFGLNEPVAVDEGLRGVRLVLHCAGPFNQTSKPMADACLRMKIHYLDITGEEEVFETLAARNAEARAAGVVLLPGVGFDVVPSDCLAAHLKRQLPTATRLALGYQGATQMSRGTALTVLESLPLGGVVREHGVLRRVPAAWKTRLIDFGNGTTKAITIPWGDVATAFYSTGIPNIEVYMAAPWGTRVAARLNRHFGWLLGVKLIHAWLKRRIQTGPPGPTEAQRRNNRCFLWGEATDEAGHKAISRLQTPDGYDLTVATSLAAVARILDDTVAPGFQTPALAFGPDFIVDIAGVSQWEIASDDKTPAERANKL